ncbi:BRISC complex subunit Abro1, partial [Stegodyphus mimosarum]
MYNTQEEIVISIYSSVPCGNFLSFYNSSGKVRESDLESYLGERKKAVVGWYRFRRHVPVYPSMRETAVHRNLKTIFSSNLPHGHECFIYGVLSSSCLQNFATHSFDYAFYIQISNTFFRPLAVKLLNLGDTKSHYRTGSVASAYMESSSFHSVLSSLWDFSSCWKTEDLIVHFHNKLRSKFDNLIEELAASDTVNASLECQIAELENEMHNLLTLRETLSSPAGSQTKSETTEEVNLSTVKKTDDKQGSSNNDVHTSDNSEDPLPSSPDHCADKAVSEHSGDKFETASEASEESVDKMLATCKSNEDSTNSPTEALSDSPNHSEDNLIVRIPLKNIGDFVENTSCVSSDSNQQSREKTFSQTYSDHPESSVPPEDKSFSFHAGGDTPKKSSLMLSQSSQLSKRHRLSSSKRNGDSSDMSESAKKRLCYGKYFYHEHGIKYRAINTSKASVGKRVRVVRRYRLPPNSGIDNKDVSASKEHYSANSETDVVQSFDEKADVHSNLSSDEKDGQQRQYSSSIGTSFDTDSSQQSTSPQEKRPSRPVIVFACPCNETTRTDERESDTLSQDSSSTHSIKSSEKEDSVPTSESSTKEL